MPFGTIRFEISPSPVTAVIVTQPVISVPALVMKIFEPSITHSPSSRRAVVRVAPASEPAFASVSPKAARLRPEARSGSHAPLLLLRAEQVDRQRAERVVRGDGDRDRRVDARQLLDADRVRERVRARTAVLLGDRHAHQPEPGELLDDLVREPLLAIELLGHRLDLLDREAPHRLAEELVLRLEVEVHGAERACASSTISRTP